MVKKVFNLKNEKELAIRLLEWFEELDLCDAKHKATKVFSVRLEDGHGVEVSFLYSGLGGDIDLHDVGYSFKDKGELTVTAEVSLADPVNIKQRVTNKTISVFHESSTSDYMEGSNSSSYIELDLENWRYRVNTSSNWKGDIGHGISGYSDSNKGEWQVLPEDFLLVSESHTWAQGWRSSSAIWYYKKGQEALRLYMNAIGFDPVVFDYDEAGEPFTWEDSAPIGDHFGLLNEKLPDPVILDVNGIRVIYDRLNRILRCGDVHRVFDVDPKCPGFEEEVRFALNMMGIKVASLSYEA